MQSTRSLKVVISGGHITPALALIDFIAEHAPSTNVVFVGREFSQDVARQESIERLEIAKRKSARFVPLRAVRWNATSLLNSLSKLSAFLRSYSDALAIITSEKPDVFVSFGGYVAVPLALAAWWRRIPIITHEQTRTVGVSTQLIGLVADWIAVAHHSSTAGLSPKKIFYTGNPIRKQLFSKVQQRPEWLPEHTDKPIVLVLGGNQGSLAINTVIAQMLEQLTLQWCVVHQCGKPTAVQNYLQELTLAKDRLPATQQRRYWAREWLTETELSWLMQHAHFAISRSGANTVTELVLSRLPAVLIPLPNSRNEEADLNATWLAAPGGAVKLAQSDLSPETLQRAITQLDSHREQCQAALATLSVEKDAAARLFALIQACVSHAQETR